MSPQATVGRETRLVTLYYCRHAHIGDILQKAGRAGAANTDTPLTRTQEGSSYASSFAHSTEDTACSSRDTEKTPCLDSNVPLANRILVTVPRRSTRLHHFLQWQTGV